jgi:hypothetical protein
MTTPLKNLEQRRRLIFGEIFALPRESAASFWNSKDEKTIDLSRGLVINRGDQIELIVGKTKGVKG